MALELADRQGVEEFVGQQEQRRLGQGVDAVRPLHRVRGEGGLLAGAQGGRGLDQHHACCSVKAGYSARSPKQIGHQRATPRTKLGQGKGGRGPLILPGLRQAQPQQFAEHLADLGPGDEVALCAERRACGVIAVVRVQQAV